MQGFNRYYPPDYDPKNAAHKGNLNRLAGKAAQKPVVRFEMPFNIWCLNCDSHIAQGVRFNAEKKKTGNYFSSPIYSFIMKCHLCTGTIIIATNPKDTCYDVLQGAKKRAEEWNAQENGTFEFSVTGAEEGDGDPIYKLERDATHKSNAQSAQSHITQLLDLNDRQWADPYAQSQKLRRGFRAEKKVLKVASDARQEVLDRHALGIPLLDLSTSDQVLSKSVDFDAANHARRIEGKQLVTAQAMFRGQARARAKEAGALAASLRSQSRLKSDPFVNADHRKKLKLNSEPTRNRDVIREEDDGEEPNRKTALVAYGSEDEESERL